MAKPVLRPRPKDRELYGALEGGIIQELNKAFPISWVTTGKHLLIVGGCLQDLCRLRHAIRFDWDGIKVVVTDDAEPLCEECCADSRVQVDRRAPREDDVRAANLVIDCTLDPDTASHLSAWCRRHGVPLNAMDQLQFCDFHYPALVMRDPIILSILTGGDAPALSSRLRKRLEDVISPGWAIAAQVFAEARNRIPAGQQRSKLLKSLAQNPQLLDLIEQNDERGIRSFIEDAIERMGI